MTELQQLIDFWIFGLCGFLITLITMCLSVGIAKKVKDSHYKRNLNENLDSELNDISKLISSLQQRREINEELHLELTKVYSHVLFQYPFLDKKLLKRIADANAVNVKSGSPDFHETFQLLVDLREVLKREAGDNKHAL